MNPTHALATRVSAAVPPLALALVLAGGCASAAGTSAPANPVNPTGSTPPNAATSPSTPIHPLGEQVDSGTGFVQATVYSYRQPAAADAPAPDKPGYTWGAVDVQACTASTSVFNVSVSSSPWRLAYPDGSKIAPAGQSPSELPKPAYPSVNVSLAPSKCVRGWIIFAVPQNTAPTMIQYAPPGSQPVNWSSS